MFLKQSKHFNSLISYSQKIAYRSRPDFHVAWLEYFYYDERVANCYNKKRYDESAEEEEQYESSESAVLRMCAGVVL